MIHLTFTDRIARLTLDRPSARNALRIQDWWLLKERIAEAAAGGARAILLAGKDGVFSAGADLRELATLAKDEAARASFRQAMRAGLEAVAHSALPVLVHVGGDCHGAGVALAMACDIRVSGPAARFSIPPAKFGILYPQPDVDRLVALVGRGRATDLLLSARRIDAEEAYRIGLVDRIDDETGLAAEKLTTAIAGNVPESVALLRRQIAGMDLAEADRLFEASFGSPAFAGVAETLLPKT